MVKRKLERRVDGLERQVRMRFRLQPRAHGKDLNQARGQVLGLVRRELQCRQQRRARSGLRQGWVQSSR